MKGSFNKRSYELAKKSVINSEYKHNDEIAKLKSKKVLQELTEMGVF